MNKTITIQFEMPDVCGTCPFYSETIHNDNGMEAHCGKGYMKGRDMRDRRFRNRLYEGCKLEIECGPPIW